MSLDRGGAYWRSLTMTPIGSAAMQLRWLLGARICALGSRCKTKRMAATSPKWKVTMEPSQSELIADDYAYLLPDHCILHDREPDEFSQGCIPIIAGSPQKPKILG